MSEPGGEQPASPESPESSAKGGNPWERRASLGGLNGFVEAVKLLVLSPGEAFAQTSKKGDYGSPLLFAIIVGWIGVVIGQAWKILMGTSILSMMPAEMRSQVPFVGGSASGFLISVFLAPVYIIIGLFLWSAILHLCLIIVGGLKRSRTGFEGSFRVVSYSTVAQLANMIPLVGGLICLVWSLVLAVVGLQKLHDASLGEATAAVLIPAVLCCVCVGLLVAAGIAGGIAMFANQ